MSVCVAFARKKTGLKRKKGRVDSVESCVIKMSRVPGIDKLVSHSNPSSLTEAPTIIQRLVNVEIKLNTEAKLDAQASALKSTIDRDRDPNYTIKVEPTTPPHASSYDEQVLPRNSPAVTNCSVSSNSSPKNIRCTSATSVQPAIKLEPVEALTQSTSSNSLTSKFSDVLTVSSSSTSQQNSTTSVATTPIIPSAPSYVTTLGNYPMPVVTNPSVMPQHSINSSLAITPSAYSGQMMPVYVPIDYFYKMMEQENSIFLKPFFPSDSSAPHQPIVGPNLKPNSFRAVEVTPCSETINVSEKDSCAENNGTDMRNHDGAPQQISKNPQRNLTIKQEPVNDFPSENTDVIPIRENSNDDDDIMILEEIIDIEEFDLTTKANLKLDALGKFPGEKVTGTMVELHKIKQEKIPGHSFPNGGPPRKVNVVMPHVSEIVTQATTIKPVTNQPIVPVPISPKKTKQSEPPPPSYRQCTRAEVMSGIKKYPSIFKISTRDTKRMFQKFEKFF